MFLVKARGFEWRGTLSAQGEVRRVTRREGRPKTKGGMTRDIGCCPISGGR
jgi:hypothetical protein